MIAAKSIRARLASTVVTLAAVLVLLAACGGSSDSGESASVTLAPAEEADSGATDGAADESEGADSPTDELEAAVEDAVDEQLADDDSGAADEELTTEPAVEAASAEGDAELFDGDEVAVGPLGSGSYLTDLVGPPLSFELSSDWLVELAEPGLVVLKDPEATSPTSEVVVIFRSQGLADSTEVVSHIHDGDLSGEPADLGAWIAAAGDVLVTDETTTIFDGHSAVVTTFGLDPEGSASVPGGCGPTPDDRCFIFASTGATTAPILIVRTTEVYRTWMIDQGSSPPLVVLAIASEEDADWLDDTAAGVIDSFRLGSPTD